MLKLLWAEQIIFLTVHEIIEIFIAKLSVRTDFDSIDAHIRSLTVKKNLQQAF